MSNNGAPAPPPMPQQQPGPFGTQWKPSGVDWGWMKVPAMRDDGIGTIETLHILVLHTMAGITGVAFTDDALKRFIQSAQIEASGILLPGQN